MKQTKITKPIERIVDSIVSIGMAAFLLYVGSMTIGASFLENRAKNYAEKNLTRIMKEQEERMGIKYECIPKLQADLPEENYAFKTAVKMIGIAAVYDKETETIHFCPWSAVFQEATLKHELGHFYFFKLAEKMNAKYWFKKLTEKTTIQEWEGIRIISEGVGEYFTLDNGIHTNCWICGKNAYHQGYHLVKPIIDKHEQKGIEYLIRNPLKPEDMKNLEGYQKRALDELEKAN